jgi:hypothetical protein
LIAPSRRDLMNRRSRSHARSSNCIIDARALARTPSGTVENEHRQKFKKGGRSSSIPTTRELRKVKATDLDKCDDHIKKEECSFRAQDDQAVHENQHRSPSSSSANVDTMMDCWRRVSTRIKGPSLHRSLSPKRSSRLPTEGTSVLSSLMQSWRP